MTGADGRRYLVTHGDELDHVVRYARWLAVLGDWPYRTALSLSTMINRARRRLGPGGTICGHIHKAEMRRIGGIAYINDGDWVESCTALVEHFDGRLEILEWAKLRSWSMIARALAPAAGELTEPLTA